MDELTLLIGEIMRITAKLEDDTTIRTGLKNRHYVKPVLCLDVIRHLGRPSFTELLNELPIKITKASLSVAVDKLIQRGFLKKTRSEDDRRVYYIELTPKGLEIFDAFNRTFDEVGKRIRSVLTPEEAEQLINILKKIVNEYGIPFPVHQPNETGA